MIAKSKVQDSKLFVKKMKYATRKKKAHEEIKESSSHVFKVVISHEEQFEAGAEVLISYNSYSNRQLLSNYGFALENNRFNYYLLRITLDVFLNEK